MAAIPAETPVPDPKTGSTAPKLAGREPGGPVNETTVAIVAAAIGAASLFPFLIGGLVLRNRLENEGLPTEEGLAVTAKDHMAVVGGTELFFSIVVTSLMLGGAWLAFQIGRRLARVEEKRAARPRVGNGFDARRDLTWRAVALLLVILLTSFSIAPLTIKGAVSALAVAAMLTYALQWGRGAWLPLGARRALGFWIAAVLVVVIVSTMRELEFPTPMPEAAVELDNGDVIDGVYVGTTADSVVLGVQREDVPALLASSGRHSGTTAQPDEKRGSDTYVLLPRDQVEKIRLPDPAEPPRGANSLLSALTPWDIACILPACAVQGKQDRLF